ncbi:type IV pili twitching motility protein PilT [Chromatium okenii]|uniref:PilT/PilU family type 4a pilus ATPase n=1 Tax=Chromatium okenii TaxID=61644 RepID=UPI0019064893|nr:PilT/PilU family type 4a pilus ATPase [Chromatium okenii]MBK1642403.1 type IV pili twitching motility protein PilT [Chromatium okenii]
MDLKRALEQLLTALDDKKGSDLFITVGWPPSIKINGAIYPAAKQPLTAEQVRGMVYEIMNERQRAEFEDTKECQFAVDRSPLGRFRVSAFVQRDSAGMILRRIESRIPTLEELKLPSVLRDLGMSKRGLVIFVGATGTGKSTSLAALIGHRNRKSNGHIITIEDPIEFVHEHDGCIITQREVGVDTESFEVALRNTLRQAPDVILIGEVRTRATMEYAINFAETGHLVLATLHANNANQALDRVINFFPEESRNQVLLDLSLNLKAIVAQQLIPRKNGQERRAVIEVLINTPLAADLIRKGEITKLKELMKNSGEQGMITFDQALFNLYAEGEISHDDAIRFADSANEVRLAIKLQGGEAQRIATGRAIDAITLVPEEDRKKSER